MDPEEIKRKGTIDRLLSTANVHRMRGDYLAAEDACKEALSVDESRLDIRELIADLLYTRGQLEASRDEYAKIMELDPARVSTEAKYAKVALEIGEREYQKKLMLDMLENPGRYSAPRGGPIAATICSVLLPGVGQMYLGEIKKGVILAGSYLFAILMLAMDSFSTKNLLKSFGAMFNPTPEKYPIDGLTIFFAAAAAFVYVYAVIDAPIAAGKGRESTPTPTPTPTATEGDRMAALIRIAKEESKKKPENEPPAEAAEEIPPQSDQKEPDEDSSTNA